MNSYLFTKRKIKVGDFPQYIVDGIIKQVSDDLGGTINTAAVHWIPRPQGKETTRDATLAIYVDGHSRKDDIVVLISNPDFPDAVADDMACAKTASDVVEGEISQHIIRPVSAGNLNGQTYGAFPRLYPMSDNRLLRVFQKRAFAADVIDWLVAFAAQTKNNGSNLPYIDAFSRPLELLSEDSEAPARVRSATRLSAEFISREQPELFTTAQHGDFGIWNILFGKKPARNWNPVLGQFQIIDWRGMRQDGYPCADLVTFCSSLYRRGASGPSAHIERYIKGLSIPRTEMYLYCLLRLGQIRANLDQFPKPQFYALCEGTLEFLKAHGIKPPVSVNGALPDD